MARKESTKKTKKKEKLARQQRAKAQSAAGAAARARAEAARASASSQSSRASLPPLPSSTNTTASSACHLQNPSQYPAASNNGKKKHSHRKDNSNALSVTISKEQQVAALAAASLVNGPEPKGLVNLGNTCFFNSTMQNVARVAPFKHYFTANPCFEIDPSHPHFATSRPADQHSSHPNSVVVVDEAAEGPLTAALRQFFRDMWNPPLENQAVLNPKRLFSEVGRNNPRFRGRNQQDAHEVLRSIFDAVVEEENDRIKNLISSQSQVGDAHPLCNDPLIQDSQLTDPSLPDQDPLHCDKGASRRDAVSTPTRLNTAQSTAATKGEMESDMDLRTNTAHPPNPSPFVSAHTSKAFAQQAPASLSKVPLSRQLPNKPYEGPPPKNVVDAVVGGTLVSTVRCLECGFCSSIVEPFLDISLPLVPRDAPPHPPVTDSHDAQADGNAVVSNSCHSEGNRSSAPRKDDHAEGLTESKATTLSEEETSSVDESFSNLEEITASCSVSAVCTSSLHVAADSTTVGCPSIPPPPPPPPPRLYARSPVPDANRHVKKVSSLDLRVELESHIQNPDNAPAMPSYQVNDDSLTEFDFPDTPPSPTVSPGASPNLSPSAGLRSPASDLLDNEEPLVVQEDCVIALGPPVELTASVNANVVSDDEENEVFAAFPLFDDDCDDDAKEGPPPATVEKEEAVTPNHVSTNPSNSIAQRASCVISSLFGGCGGGSQLAPYGYQSIIGSFESFTQPEVLEGDNAYGCEQCTKNEIARRTEEKRQTIMAGSRVPRSFNTMNVSGNTLDFTESHDGENENVQEVPPVDEVSSIRGGSVSLEPASSSSLALQGPGGSGAPHDLLSSSPVTSRESSCGGPSELDSCSGRSEEDSDKEEEEHHLKHIEVTIPTVRTRAEKRFLIRDAPAALIIHLKRFSQFGYRGNLRKISGHVEFPIELDLSLFVESSEFSDGTPKPWSQLDSSCLTQSNSKGHGRYKQNRPTDTETSVSEYRYLLTGLCVHEGSLHGGHYTAFVREGVNCGFRGSWFHCSDSRVRRVTEKEVLASEAFMLFYERIKP